MSLPTKPNSTTGQISLINLASEVPPLVDKLGTRPVIDFIALFSDPTKWPGFVKKGSALQK